MSAMPNDEEKLREEVRERYGRTALQVLQGTEADASAAGCCSTGSSCSDTNAGSCCGTSDADPVTSGLYSNAELGELPVAAALASRGCGNPTALAELKPGEKVLDLGSGGGIDVLLSARRVGPTGFAYGLDMTDAMLELAERNRTEAGVENVRFLKGIIEDIPLPA
jgi:2-polyprenyl-3-methyl-5-hydroxy-6-metoxy-1,4-benzoquinol methylase